MEVENVDCDTEVKERQNTKVESTFNEDATKVGETEDVKLDDKKRS